jgi:hypothetical protein
MIPYLSHCGAAITVVEVTNPPADGGVISFTTHSIGIMVLDRSVSAVTRSLMDYRAFFEGWTWGYHFPVLLLRPIRIVYPRKLYLPS